ncbi:MAG TPA: type I-C CRISPR-associated protein Cas8c/Csd1 [Geobacteraceae bacterium]|mgnify:CR=1 FL=1|nr:type I-C CRISPR-associated protein Cas8c/Csd1 [Geobacteraceae bacterium]
MIKELSELGKFLRAGKADDAWVHDALKEETISMELVIMPDGAFHGIQLIENKMTPAEAITAKKGKARLLLDKPEEVLCYGGNISKKKHKLFLEKIALYKALDELAPVIAFYKNNENGLDRALTEFNVLATTDDKKVKKKLTGNISFRIYSESSRIHEKVNVLQAIIDRYETTQREQLANNSKKCSVCGKSDHPVEDIPHGMIKKVPDGQSSGCALISYNENAFESYGLKGNNNSSICTNCAKTYVEGLNWLLSSGNEIMVTDKKGKSKPRFRYTNRKNFGADTAMVFWTRNNQALDEIDLLDTPSADEVAKMIESLASGNATSHHYLEPERFYSCTLSGAAARIAVRDWIETSLGEFRASIAQWFKDIAIGKYDADLKKTISSYASLYALARSCQRQRMKSDGTYEYDKDDAATARVAVALWKAALHKASIPTWILSKALQRARYDVSTERAALIKLFLVRNTKGGCSMIMENDVQGKKPVAYVCGQIFAKLEHIQYKALGDRNAGIREKYFTYAMTTPAAAFGRLFNLNSKHLTKLKSEQPGTAVNLDKELQELCREIDILKFPQQFLLEEQGQFAIGYYHQKQVQFAGSNNK